MRELPIRKANRKYSELRQGIAALGLLLSLTIYLPVSGLAQPATDGLTPEQAWTTLKAGNERFLAGHPQYPNLSDDRRRAIASGDHPYAAILSCADSRVVPELLFDAGLGELVVERVGGNVADITAIASMEDAVRRQHVPLLIVLGHLQCNAVASVVSQAPLHGSLPALVENIRPAVRDARALQAGKGTDDLAAAAVAANVLQSMADLLRRSTIIRTAVADGKTRLIGGVYTMTSGVVTWLGQHPEEKNLLDHPDEEQVASSLRVIRKPAPAETPDEIHSPYARGASDGITPRIALTRLIEGNLRFADDPRASVERPNRSKERRLQVSKAEHPWGAILTCTDSRVVPEHLFDVGLGDLVTVRLAGNIAATDAIASLEYAAVDLHTPLIVVLGHTDCDAVRAAVQGGNLPGYAPVIADAIEPAIERAEQRANADTSDVLASSIRENVRQAMADLLSQSAELTAYVQAGALRVVGGIYHVESGRVEWLGEHPDQTHLVASRIVDENLGIDLEEVVAPGSSPTPALKMQPAPTSESAPPLAPPAGVKPDGASGDAKTAHPAPHH